MSTRSSSGLPISSPQPSSRTSATSGATRPHLRPNHHDRLKVCHICQEIGHIAKYCPGKECWTCGSHQHVRNNCPRHVENIRSLVEQRAKRPFQPALGRVRQPYQVHRSPFEATITAEPPAPTPIPTHSKSSAFLRCETCGSMFHSKEDCHRTNYKFSEANERSLDELPSIPVLLTPIKTAAALASDRKYAEKLAAIESRDDEKEGGNKAEVEEEVGEKQGVSKVKEPGDLIEFD